MRGPPRCARPVRRVLVDDAVEHAVRGALAERRGADPRVRRDLPQCEDVGRRGDGGPHGLFGRHEGGRADRDAAAGQRGGVGGPGDAEVDDARTVGGQQHVGRLQIAVHDAGAVDDLEGLGDPGDHQQHGGDGESAVFGDGGGECGAGDVGGGEPGHRAVGVAVDHRGGEQPLDPLRGVHLLREPAAELRVFAELGPDHLDGHRPPAGRVGEVDLAHSAGTELRRQAVPRDHVRVVARQRLEVPGRLRTVHHLRPPTLPRGPLR